VAKRKNSGSDCGINSSFKRASEDENESMSTKDLWWSAYISQMIRRRGVPSILID
jgi:hypothetical protein